MGVHKIYFMQSFRPLEEQEETTRKDYSKRKGTISKLTFVIVVCYKQIAVAVDLRHILNIKVIIYHKLSP